jgi:glycosyltransferase involved in cell wall biosynthesis
VAHSISNSANALPKISIITTSLNSVESLERAILSVVNQNYPDLEYIVVDGGSTDGTLDIIRKYQAHITRWVSEKDEGAAYAANKGIRMASGELIALLNSDDFYLEGTFEKVAAAAMQNPEAEVFYGDLIYVGPVRPPFRAHSWRRVRKSAIDNRILGPTLFIRRSCYMKHGLWDTSYEAASDYELSTRLVFSGVKFHYLDEPLVCMHWGGTSSQRPDVGTAEMREILRKYDPSLYARWRLELMFFRFRTTNFLKGWGIAKPFVNLYVGVRNRFFRVPLPHPPAAASAEDRRGES